MRRGWVRRALILLAAALLCFGMLRYGRDEEPESTGTLTLWYLEGGCPRQVMEGLLARCRAETGLTVTATAYPDENTFGAAFESGRPDLIFCSHLRAGKLEERGSLSDITDAVLLPEALREAGEEIGVSFFPIGARLPLLLVNTALARADYAGFEDLAAEAGDTPFLSSDDWAELLYTMMFASGRQMRGDAETDEKDARYRTLYNSLAEAVFRGGFVPAAENPVDAVRQGLLPCAVVRSTQLAGLTEEGLAARLLPLPEGAETGYPAELMGFALLEGADGQAAGSFLHLLFNTTAGSETALSCGLVPVLGGAEGHSAIEQTLSDISGSGVLRYPPADDPFYGRREALEGGLRETFELLN